MTPGNVNRIWGLVSLALLLAAWLMGAFKRGANPYNSPLAWIAVAASAAALLFAMYRYYVLKLGKRDSDK